MTVSEAGASVTTGSQPMIEGTCHLLPLISHGRLLLATPLSRRAPGLGAHLPLQLLQTLFHLRWHLQTGGGGAEEGGGGGGRGGRRGGGGWVYLQSCETSLLQEWQRDMRDGTARILNSSWTKYLSPSQKWLQVLRWCRKDSSSNRGVSAYLIRTTVVDKIRNIFNVWAVSSRSLFIVAVLKSCFILSH